MIQMQKIKMKWKEIWQADRGTYTLEATMVVPFIFISVFIVLFFAVFMFENLFLQISSQSATERVSFTWDNSYKHIVTGNYIPGQSDGLYWRMTQDQLTDVFTLFSSKSKHSSQSAVAFPVLDDKQDASLTSKKIKRAVPTLPIDASGSMTFRNLGYERTVELQLERYLFTPRFVSQWVQLNRLKSQSKSWVVDPVEMIRFFDLIQHHIPIISKLITPDRFTSLLREPENTLADRQVLIRSESQAQAYLRTLVSGYSTTLITSTGKERWIDAMDQNGIAHQAFYSFSITQLLKEQLTKDEELLQSSIKVKGVVWHFFLKKGKTKIELPENVMQQIRQKGIVIVLHE